jgi:hypothetical protein
MKTNPFISFLFSRFVDSHRVDNDENMSNVLLFTNDSQGAYISFPEGADLGMNFRKTYLNIICNASTDEGYRIHRTILSTPKL